MRNTRVLIADDEALFAAALERLLSTECVVVATVHDTELLSDQVRELRPQIVILGLSRAPLSRMYVIDELRKIDPQIKTVVVTTSNEPQCAADAFRRGAAAYVLKDSSVSELLDALRSAKDRKTYVTPLIAASIVRSLARPAQHPDGDTQLTDRQLEVLRLLARGKSMKEVASALNVTARTVAFHKYRMMQMLNITNSAELVRFAVVRHIV